MLQNHQHSYQGAHILDQIKTAALLSQDRCPWRKEVLGITKATSSLSQNSGFMLRKYRMLQIKKAPTEMYMATDNRIFLQVYSRILNNSHNEQRLLP
jgi:hypothetical protein